MFKSMVSGPSGINVAKKTCEQAALMCEKAVSVFTIHIYDNVVFPAVRPKLFQGTRPWLFITNHLNWSR